MYADIEVVKKFDKWMKDLKNIHYSNVPRMTEAYNRLTPLKYRCV